MRKNKFISERSSKGIKSINWIGVYTLFKREVARFLKIHLQTIWGPALTTLLFLVVFALALGRATRLIQDIPFLEFLAPGLIVMAMIQNAFGNASSSLLSAKVAGNIIDLLLPPLTSLEFASAFLAGAVCRGLLVGIAVALLVIIFVPLNGKSFFICPTKSVIFFKGGKYYARKSKPKDTISFEGSF